MLLLDFYVQNFILIALINFVIAIKFDFLPSAKKQQQQQQQLNNFKLHQQLHQHQILTGVTTTNAAITNVKPTTSALCGFITATNAKRNEQEHQQYAVNNCNAINVLIATLNDNNNFMLNKKPNNNDSNDDGHDENKDEAVNEIENRNEKRNDDDLLSEISNFVEMSPSAIASSSVATTTAATLPILSTLTMSTRATTTATAATATVNTTSAAAVVPIMPASSSSSTTSTPLAASAVVAAAAAAAAELSQNLKLKRHFLSRPKRYLAFPEGSSFTVSVCFTVGIIGNPSFNYMSFGLNWGVAYDLPNSSWVLNHLHGFSRHPVPPPVLRRRTRRTLYKEVERAVDNMGYNGRDCVLRALCESRQYFQRTKLGMIGEMLRVIFSLPKQRLYTRELNENYDMKFYDHAYRKARAIDCAAQYDCTFSLLELALGRYSTPPPGYYEQHN